MTGSWSAERPAVRSQSRRVRKTPSLARSSGGAGHSVRRRIGELILAPPESSLWRRPVLWRQGVRRRPTLGGGESLSLLGKDAAVPRTAGSAVLGRVVAPLERRRESRWRPNQPP